jgi:phosphoribosylanthranilate isomerase
VQVGTWIVGPAAVDVNSGIEDVAGAKDPQRAEAFVQVCRSWGKLPLTP